MTGNSNPITGHLLICLKSLSKPYSPQLPNEKFQRDKVPKLLIWATGCVVWTSPHWQTLQQVGNYGCIYQEQGAFSCFVLAVACLFVCLLFEQGFGVMSLFSECLFGCHRSLFFLTSQRQGRYLLQPGPKLRMRSRCPHHWLNRRTPKSPVTSYNSCVLESAPFLQLLTWLGLQLGPDPTQLCNLYISLLCHSRNLGFNPYKLWLWEPVRHCCLCLIPSGKSTQWCC